MEDAAASLGPGYAFADCPGFLDNRGFEINVANAVNIKQTLAAARSVRVVVLINYFSLRADRGKGVRELTQILADLFGTSGEEKLAVLNFDPDARLDDANLTRLAKAAGGGRSSFQV